MFRYFAPSGEELSDTGFKLDGESFPAGWLALVDAAALARYGIERQEMLDPDPAPPFAPVEATPRQLRLAMVQSGVYDQVVAMAAQLQQSAQVEFEYASVYHRAHPMWDAAAAALGKTPADVDALFAMAVTL